MDKNIEKKLEELRERKTDQPTGRYSSSPMSEVFKETLRRTLREGITPFEKLEESSDEETSITASARNRDISKISQAVATVQSPVLTEKEEAEADKILTARAAKKSEEMEPLITLEEEEKEEQPQQPSAEIKTSIQRVLPIFSEGKYTGRREWGDEEIDTSPVVLDPLEIKYDKIDILIGQAGYFNLTFSANEAHALERKISQLKHLTIKDCIMFLEGYRSCSRFAEAKIAQMCEEMNKTIEGLKANIRGLEVSVSSCKAQEKTYLDLVEQLKMAKEEEIQHTRESERAAIQAIQEQLKEMEDEIKQSKASKISRKREKEREEEMIATRIKEEKYQQELIREKEQRMRKKTQAVSSQTNQEVISEKGSESDDACAALLIITEDINHSVSTFLSYYHVTIEEVNKILRTWPNTEEGLVEKYGSVRKAYVALNAILKK